MESGGAGQGGNGTGGSDAGGDAGGEAAGGLDPAAITASLATMADGQEQTRQMLEAMQSQLAPQDADSGADPAADLPDLSWLAETGEGGDDGGPDLDRLAAQLGESITKATAAATAPALERVKAFETQQRWNEIATEFPEFADPKTASEVSGVAVQYAAHLAQQSGNPALAELGTDPEFNRLIYMAGRAAEQHNAEGGNGANLPHLEGGGGASAGGSPMSMADQIVGAKKGSAVLPFQ